MRICRILTAALAACTFAPAVSAGPEDWSAFMAEQDMVWDRLPEGWHEAPFMGNGSLGTYICLEPETGCLRIEAGNSMAHDHRKDDLSIYGRGRLLTGHFLLEPEGKILSGTMRLDLWNAETRAEIVTDRGTITLRALVTSEAPYIVTEAEGSGREKGFRWRFVPESSDSPRQIQAIIRKNKQFKADYKSNPPAVTDTADGIGRCLQPLLDGGLTCTAWKELEHDGRRILIVSSAHTWPAEDAGEKAVRAVRGLSAADVAILEEEHRKWWHGYWPESFVSLPDKKVENFYWIQMYKMASATRVGGGLMDNSGPWQTLTSWPNAWWNLNVQLSYWPVCTSNRLEIGRPLADAVHDNMANLAANVPEKYRESGALGLPVATGFDLRGTEVGVPGGKKVAQMGCLPWLCHDLWMQYRYSMDESLLRETVYPALRGAVNLYLPFLYEDADGTLHLQETYSPEYGSAEDCCFDLALLRWGCQTLIEACGILGIDDELIPRWKDVLERLTDYPRNEDEGIMIGKDLPYARTHRHFSHLLMFYPLHLLNADMPGSRELMEKSVRHWHSIPGNLLGYSMTGASLMYASFGYGDTALDYLYRLFDTQLLPNTMYTEHSGPTIETPLSGAQCVHEMLLQSWGGKIRVFPAVPSAWDNVAFEDLRTEGAFLVSAVREGGKTVCIRIKSLTGEPCVLRTDMCSPEIRSGQAGMTALGEGEYSIGLRKGETVILAPEGEPLRQIRPAEGMTAARNDANYFGLRE